MSEVAPAPDPTSLIRSRRFLVLLVLAALTGLGVSLVSWGFLELIHQIQVGVFTDLPRDLGYQNGTPLWYYLPVLLLAGAIAAFAIARLPGNGGHVPAYGLNPGSTEPIALPGVVLAALATIGLGVVLGPEAPLIALGSGLGLFAVRRARGDAPQQVQAVLAATGSFAAVAMIFGSPLIAAVILIEAAGIGGAMLPVILLPGLLGAAIGSLVSIGIGSLTGLSTSAYSIGALSVPQLARPDIADFGWTLLLAAVVALGATAIVRSARGLVPLVASRPFLLLPASGLVVAGLAIAFQATTDKGAQQVLFSGQDSLNPLVSGAADWSISALLLLIAFKGIAWCISLAGFRGGPTFPAMFLGAAAGVLASHLPGFEFTAAVAVGMSAGVAAVLRLPLAAMVLGTLLTDHSGPGAAPLVIVGVVVAYLVAVWVDPKPATAPQAPVDGSRPPAASQTTGGSATRPAAAAHSPS